jgi:hypothetical protein
MLCSYCKPRGLKYWAKEGHFKYAQYTRRGRQCDGKGILILKGLLLISCLFFFFFFFFFYILGLILL